MKIKLLLKKTVKNNKWLIIGIELCLLFSVVCLLYAYNFTIKILFINTDITYTVDTKNDSYLNVSKIVGKLNHDNYSKVILMHNDGIGILAHGDIPYLDSGRLIKNQNEIISGKKEDINNIGSIVLILGKEYKIVGVSTSTHLDYLLLPDSISADTKIKKLIAESNYSVSPNDTKNEIKHTFNKYSIVYPKKVRLIDMMDSYVSMSFAIVLTLTMFAFAICFKFLIDEVEKPLQLYKFSGLDYGTTMSTLCIYQVSFLIVPIFVGSIAYFVLEKYCFNLVLSFLPIRYNLQFKYYLQIALLIMFLQLFFALPFMRKIAKKNIEIRNYEE